MILLEDSRPTTPPPFDQAEQQLSQRLQQEQIRKPVGDLRAKAKVEQATCPPPAAHGIVGAAGAAESNRTA